jgi:hypothetical protein
MITVVSGIPRSGTSLMMQMLAAGGMPVMTDGQRTPDPNNPRGYYEFELVKSLSRNPGIVAEAEGKAIKVISSLLNSLPAEHEYRIIFMRRPLLEIIASQDKMLERLGKPVPPVPKESIMSAFEKHLKQVMAWLAVQANISVLYVEYPAVLEDARHQAIRIREFLEFDLLIDAMASKVEHSLHREKVSA